MVKWKVYEEEDKMYLTTKEINQLEFLINKYKDVTIFIRQFSSKVDNIRFIADKNKKVVCDKVFVLTKTLFIPVKDLYTKTGRPSFLDKYMSEALKHVLLYGLDKEFNFSVYAKYLSGFTSFLETLGIYINDNNVKLNSTLQIFKDNDDKYIKTKLLNTEQVLKFFPSEDIDKILDIYKTDDINSIEVYFIQQDSLIIKKDTLVYMVNIINSDFEIKLNLGSSSEKYNIICNLIKYGSDTNKYIELDCELTRNTIASILYNLKLKNNYLKMLASPDLKINKAFKRLLIEYML